MSKDTTDILKFLMLGFIVALCTRTKVGLLTVDILVIANPDVEFSEAFLIRVVQDMIHLHVQAASGYMKMPDSQLLALLNRKINSYWHELLSCTVLLKRIIHSKINYVLPNQGILQVEWLPGSWFAIDAFVYKKLRGLDDRVFLFYEEQILGKKFLKLGYKMIIDTDISFLHNHSISIFWVPILLLYFAFHCLHCWHKF